MHRAGAMIRAAREAAQLSQSDLAAAIGLENHSSVSRVESGDRDLAPNEYVALLRALPTLRPGGPSKSFTGRTGVLYRRP